MRAGFQRRVDEQAERYAPRLAHAERLATYSECGDVVGVFTAPVGGGVRPSAYVAAYVPLALIPFLIIGAASRIPGALLVLGLFPFAWGAWFGVCLWRGRDPKRDIWFYAFTEGFMLLDGSMADAVPVRWNQVTEVSQVWGEMHSPASEEPRPVLTAYRLRTADGQPHEISRSLKNVRDPYQEIGQLFRTIAPGSVGKTMPTFPTVDQIIAAYAGRPGPRP